MPRQQISKSIEVKKKQISDAQKYKKERVAYLWNKARSILRGIQNFKQIQ
jgi:hypothetical protein